MLDAAVPDHDQPMAHVQAPLGDDARQIFRTGSRRTRGPEPAKQDRGQEKQAGSDDDRQDDSGRIDCGFDHGWAGRDV